MEQMCEGDEQCLYDAAAMGSLQIGEKTKHAHSFYRILHESMKSGKFYLKIIIKMLRINFFLFISVNSCGIFLMKGGIRSTTKGNYLVGSVMKLKCDKGYTLFGWDEYYCNWNATWLPTNGQWIERFRDWPYCERN
jgi:hypothetical protein